MLVTITESAEYICEKIKEVDWEEANKDVIAAIITEKVYKKLEGKLSEEDMKILSDNEENDEFTESYMIQKVPNYSTLLENAVTELLAEYLTEWTETQ